jgi:hypothetical protein
MSNSEIVKQSKTLEIQKNQGIKIFLSRVTKKLSLKNYKLRVFGSSPQTSNSNYRVD